MPDKTLVGLTIGALRFDFKGIISNALRGFFSNYTAHTNDTTSNPGLDFYHILYVMYLVVCS